MGMQVIATALGLEIKELEQQIRGFHKVDLVLDHPLNQGLPPHLIAYQNHRRGIDASEIDSNPTLQIMGSSKNGAEVITIAGRQIVGVQFHPEADYNHPDAQGRLIFDSFMDRI